MISRISPLLKPRKQSGFGLLEMLLVLAIVGVLSAMAIPSFNHFTASRAVATVAQEFKDGVELARVHAQSFGRDIKICPVVATNLDKCASLSATAPWYAWIVLDEGRSQVIWRSNVIPASVSLFGNASQGEIINQLGRPNTGAGFSVSVTAIDANLNVDSKKIFVAPSGRVKYEK